MEGSLCLTPHLSSWPVLRLLAHGAEGSSLCPHWAGATLPQQSLDSFLFSLAHPELKVSKALPKNSRHMG